MILFLITDGKTCVSLNTGGSIVGAGYLDGLFTPFDVQPTASGIATLTHTDGRDTFEARYRALQLLDGKLRQPSQCDGDGQFL